VNPVVEFLDRVLEDLNEGMAANPNEDNVVMVPAYEAIKILDDVRRVALGAEVAKPAVHLYCSKCGQMIQSSLVGHWKRKHNYGGY